MRLDITFFMNSNFNIPQLDKFIARAESLGLLNRAEVKFYYARAVIVLGSGSPARVELEIKCDERSLQVLSMAQVCRQLSPLIGRVEHLNLCELATLQTDWKNVDPTQWIGLLEPFIGVHSLSVFGKLSPPVARALQELTSGRVTEVLPALRSLLLEQPWPSVSMWDDIGPFIVRRQRSNLPVDVHYIYRHIQYPVAALIYFLTLYVWNRPRCIGLLVRGDAASTCGRRRSENEPRLCNTRNDDRRDDGMCGQDALHAPDSANFYPRRGGGGAVLPFAVCKSLLLIE
ncbi:hypothetical protein BJV74DRAFT_796944 [Russula compacta]|nr:hypothetical protein BJV74DRAFT_796944 [Russula compacta]